MLDVLVFLIFAGVAVGCAVNLILQHHPISSALSLIGVMVSLAVLYLQLGAAFIAAAQLVVYAGAIMVLFVFVIMLLNAGAEKRSPKMLSITFLGITTLAALFGLIVYVILAVLPPSPGVKFETFTPGSPYEIGMRLFTAYVLPFEATSVLILIAILGAIVLARREVE